MSQILFDLEISASDTTMPTWFVHPTQSQYFVVGKSFDKKDRQRAFASLIDTQDSDNNWTKVLDTEYGSYFNSVAQLDANRFICAGSIFNSEQAYDQNFFLFLIDTSGQTVWQAQYKLQDTMLDAYQATAVSDGGFIVTGLELNLTTNDLKTRVIKYKKSGELFEPDWTQTYDGVIAFSIIERDGGYTLGGGKPTPDGFDYYPHVFRIDGSGNPIWAKTYTDVESYVLQDSQIIATANGDYVLAAGAAIVRLNNDGNKIWSRQNANFKLHSVAELADGKLAFAGTQLFENVSKAYLIVLDPIWQAIAWDNTAILFDSDATHVAIANELPTCCGYGPQGENAFIGFIASFWNAEKFNPDGTEPSRPTVKRTLRDKPPSRPLPPLK